MKSVNPNINFNGQTERLSKERKENFLLTKSITGENHD